MGFVLQGKMFGHRPLFSSFQFSGKVYWTFLQTRIFFSFSFFFSFDWFVKQGLVVLEISYKDFQVKTMKAQNGLAVLSEKELPKDGSLFVAR